MTTRSPGLQLVTSGPTSSTIPIGSWPRVSPSPMNGPITSYRWRSDPQIAVEVIRTIASVGSWICGSGTSSTRTSLFPCQATAFMVGLPLEVGLRPLPGAHDAGNNGYWCGVGDYVGTYLNDHLAGATVGRELSKRAAGENNGTPLGSFLETLHEEIAEDGQTLLDVMDALDAGEDHLKTIMAPGGQRIGRL